MPNAFKYSTGSETFALKKGNFYIGTGDVGKGPTSTTGYYNGITPPSGGYTIYLNKETGGPSIYTPSTDAQLIELTNSIAGASYTTVNECLVYFAGQTDKLCFNREYEPIVTDGLVLNLDAGFTPSYPRSTTGWTDLSGNGNNCTLVNGPTFNSSQGGGIKFDATDDYATIPDNNSLDLASELTLSLWFNRGSVFSSLPNSRIPSHNLFIKGNSNAPGGEQINYSVSLDVLSSGFGGRYVWRDPSIVGVGILSPPSQVLFGNQWYNLVFTHVSTNAPIAYLNGVKQTNWTATNPTNALVPNTWQATICGDANREDKAATFNGIMSIVQLYNRALSETEVLQNWNALKGRFGL